MLPAIFMAPAGEDGGMMNLVFMLMLIFVFYFFLLRPQSKRQKEIQQKLGDMKKGDKVITNGGVIGHVVAIEDDSVLLEVDANVKIRFVKTAIIDVNPGKK